MEIIHQVADEISELICDRCGKSSGRSDDTNYENKVEFASFKTSWGYFSDKDGDRHAWDLCEKCYDEMLVELERMGIKVRKTNYIFDLRGV